MDRRVTVKFWKMQTSILDGLDFDVSLASAFSKTDSDLAKEIEGQTYQLEPKPSDSGVYYGDVLRLQSEYFPSRVKKGNKAEKLSLNEGEYLGHHTAFVYEIETKILGFEVKPAAAGLSKFYNLISLISGNGICEAYPILDKHAIDRLSGTKNGSFSIKIADPHSLSTIDPELSSIRDNIAHLVEMVDGAYINISIGAGPRRTGLDDSKLKKTISWLIGERNSGRGKIRSVTVNQPHEAEPILDFVKAHFKDTKELSLSGNPEADWTTRAAFLKSALAKAKAHVRSF